MNSEKFKHTKPVLLISIISIFITSTGCVTLYKPNTINSPMLKEKGELNASAAFGFSGSGLYNLQTSYAVSDHIGIMLNGMYHTREITSDDNSVDRLNMLFVEAGGGYFSSFGKNTKGLFQCYGGMGYGSTTDKIEYTTQIFPEVSAEYINAFIQPGIVHADNNFKIGIDVRVNYVSLYNIHAFLYEYFDWWNTDFTYQSDATLDFVNIEPAMTVQGGGEKIKAVFQLGAIIPAINAQSYFDVNSSSLFVGPLLKFAVGINYSFGKKKTSK